MRALQQCSSARHSTGTSASGGTNPQNSNKRLHTHLQRMKTLSTTTTSSTDTLRTSASQNDTTPTTTLSSPPPTATDRPDSSFLNEEELATMSPSQQAFLVRKRKYTLGLGPLFSAESECVTCNGTGMVTCHQCNGTGFNGELTQEKMFDPKEGDKVRIQNGCVNVSYYFVPNGPCWLCTARTSIACSECAGSGIKGLAGFQVD